MENIENQKDISDEEFISNYSKHSRHKNRSERHTKKDDKKTSSNIGFYIFLGISFLVAYYIFSTYIFVPKI